MILIIPICSLIINSGAVFSYDELAGRGCEKAHEERPTSCGFLNGVHSVRHHASHLLFLTSILKSIFIPAFNRRADTQNAHFSVLIHKTERQALLSWNIVALHGLDVNTFLKKARNTFLKKARDEEYACVL